MATFGIELSKEGNTVILSSIYTTNPQAFPYTGKAVIGLNGNHGSAKDIMLAFQSIDKNAKKIELVLQGPAGPEAATITPIGIMQRFKEWLEGLPTRNTGPYSLIKYTNSPRLRQSMMVTPDGKSIIEGEPIPTTSSLKIAFPH